MVEKILSTIQFPFNSSIQTTYALTEVEPVLKGMKKNEYRTLELKPLCHNGKLSCTTNRMKEYRSDGAILRTAGDYYLSEMPKNGTGYFAIHDRSICMEGEMIGGKISKINHFYRRNPSTYEKEHILYNVKGFEDATRNTVENFLKAAESGTLRLQNLTKVTLKKILEVLPK